MQSAANKYGLCSIEVDYFATFCLYISKPVYGGIKICTVVPNKEACLQRRRD